MCHAADWFSLRLQVSCELKSEFRFFIYPSVLLYTARFFIALFSLILYHLSCWPIKREKEPIRQDPFFLSFQNKCGAVNRSVTGSSPTLMPVLKQSSMHLHCYDKKESYKLQPYPWKKIIKFYFWSLYERSASRKRSMPGVQKARRLPYPLIL